MICTVNIYDTVKDESLYAMYRVKNPVLPVIGGSMNIDGLMYRVADINTRYVLGDGQGGDDYVGIFTVYLKPE